ncbi:MAG: NAD(P)H-dependent oxidoreductase [Planctomycetota bacterium]
MHVLIVHAHHEPKSFNSAMTARASRELEDAGHTVVVSDLYAMGFNPVSDRRNFTTVADADYLKQQREERHAHERGGFAPDIAAEMDKLDACDLLIFQYPLWWFGMPAILKGWVDRVLAMGRMYGGGRWYDAGALRDKRGMVAMTTGGPEPMYVAPEGHEGLNPPLGTILTPVHHGVFWFTGMHVLEPFVAWAPAHLDDEQRAALLDGYAAHLRDQLAQEGAPPPVAAEYPPPQFVRPRRPTA